MINSVNSNQIIQFSGTNLIKQKVEQSNVEKPTNTKEVQTLPNSKTITGQDLVNSDNISFKDLDNLFKEIKNLNGRKFSDAAYSGLVKLMGLEGMAPEKITWEKSEGRDYIVGDYRFYNNSVVFYTDNFNKLDKATQLGIIAHELTHCKQFVNMIRTEGMSVDKIAYAHAVADMRAMLINNPAVIEKHKKAKAEGKEKEFIQKNTMLWAMKTAEEIKSAHAKTIQMPKHPLNSKNGKKAQADWVAKFNYNGADMESYNKNPNEVEAYTFENMIKGAFVVFCKIEK